jgi:hypothetical protein
MRVLVAEDSLIYQKLLGDWGFESVPVKDDTGSVM